MPPHGYEHPTRPGPPRSGSAAGAQVEQLLLDAQRQITEYVKAVAAEAGQIRAAADTYAAGLRSAAEFETASVRTVAEREAAMAAARIRAAAERERDDIVRVARREADEIRRRQQFLLEQTEALRSQAEADLEIELSGRREKVDQQEAEWLAEAQEATRTLVDGAERRAADAEMRAAQALARAEQIRHDADEHAQQELADAHHKAELAITAARDEARQLLTRIEADAGQRRAVLKRELDELTRQKHEIDVQLAKMRQFFAVDAVLDIPAS